MESFPARWARNRLSFRVWANAQSFNSCSHGAGRKMSRTAAKKAFTREDLERQTAGVECRKDAGVIDEIPSAYKDIDEVMRNHQTSLKIVAQLKQVRCVKIKGVC
jgi:tRNA-splicing ligase RtcB